MTTTQSGQLLHSRKVAALSSVSIGEHQLGDVPVRILWPIPPLSEAVKHMRELSRKTRNLPRHLQLHEKTYRLPRQTSSREDELEVRSFMRTTSTLSEGQGLRIPR